MEREKIELPLLKGKDREKAIPIVVVCGIIGMLLILLVVCLSLTFKREYKLHYSDVSNLDYNVYLKDNPFYDMKYLPKDKIYVASLIDYIDADFDYIFKSDESIGLEYTYYVRASVLINNSDGKNIFKKEDTLLDKKSFSDVNKDTFSVNENVKVDYAKYNKLASDFIDQLNITADAKLVVSLYVDVLGKHAEFDKNISDKAVISLNIPLATRGVDISMDYNLSNNVDEVLQYRSTMISNPVLFGFAVLLAVLDICSIIGVITYVIINRDNQTLYNKKLAKILKDYERYISETAITQRVEDMMKTQSLRIEIIKTFEDLVDIRDSLEKPILYHEERPGEEAVFYILADRIGYIYVMRASEMRKEKAKNKMNADIKEKKEITKRETK